MRRFGSWHLGLLCKTLCLAKVSGPPEVQPEEEERPVPSDPFLLEEDLQGAFCAELDFDEFNALTDGFPAARALS